MPPTSPESHDPPPDLDPTLDASTLSIRSPGRTAPHSPPPQSIGDYVIIGKLGEGGMGVVYEAQQQHPKRRVALKVVRGGHFVSEIEIKMFEREAETLARLKHPNIAAIYESGRTEDGQHFFAMELVQGETLDAYTSHHTDIAVRERLRLFRQICDAVKYAHQRGVIHRDLKPSNIVVVEEEVPAVTSGAGAGSSATHMPAVKILDFGLARITDADAAVSIVTEVGAIKGTLPYMSPEQARGNPADIDLRTDVYSLGVILYEMLAGTLPYDTRASSMLEAMRVICEAAPRPIRTDRRDIHADLETLVLKALEKQPDRRYQSAAAFSDDIDRYIANQPILARPPSTVYQIKKLVARNKLPFAFAGGVVVLLAAFGVWMSVLYSRAETARADSEAVTGFLSSMLAAVDPGKEGKDVTVREILDEAAKSVGTQFEEQPLVRARLMGTMGEVYEGLGLFSESRPLLESSLGIREKALAADHPDVAQSLNSLANLSRETGDYGAALPLFERALAIREKALGPDHLDVAQSLNNLGAMLYTAGHYAKAQPLLERALAIREKALGPDHPDVAVSLGNVASLLTATGDYARARPLFERALKIREKALGPDHLEIAVDLTNLGVLLQETGDHEGARPLYERAFHIAEKTLGPDHPDVARPLENLANVLENTGDSVGALSLYKRALTIQEKALGPDYPGLAWSLSNLADLHEQFGDYSEARFLYERTLSIVEESSGPDSSEVVVILDGLAGTMRHLGEQAKAVTLEARAKAIREKQAKPDA